MTTTTASRQPAQPAEAVAALQRLRLKWYVRGSFPARYDMQPHHRLIVQHLEAVERRDINRLMIFMPPRRGKSELASVRFPAWHLGRRPDEPIIACSHTASLAHDFSRQVRRQIGAPGWPFPGVAVAADQGAVGQWGIDGRRGGYISAGVGGAIVGKGGHLLIDDPVKSREQAQSPAYRERAYQWYVSDALTRLPPDGWIIMILTRWHEDDLAGRALNDQKAGGDAWTVLELKEMAEENDADPLGRSPGEVLWPKRFPANTTLAIRETAPHVWWPLFQQRPQAVAGGMFRREYFTERYDPAVPPEFSKVVQLVDSAFGVSVGNDPSAIATWGRTANLFYLIDYWSARVEYPELISAIKDQYAKWRHLRPHVYIENKASGQSAIQTLKRETTIPVRKYEPGTQSKVSRVQDATPFFAAGRIRVPGGKAPPAWLSAWIEEHVGFPTAAHDEAPDTSAMAMRILPTAVMTGRLTA